MMCMRSKHVRVSLCPVSREVALVETEPTSLKMLSELFQNDQVQGNESYCRTLCDLLHVYMWIGTSYSTWMSHPIIPELGRQHLNLPDINIQQLTRAAADQNYKLKKKTRKRLNRCVWFGK